MMKKRKAQTTVEYILITVVMVVVFVVMHKAVEHLYNYKTKKTNLNQLPIFS